MAAPDKMSSHLAGWDNSTTKAPKVGITAHQRTYGNALAKNAEKKELARKKAKFKADMGGEEEEEEEEEERVYFKGGKLNLKNYKVWKWLETKIWPIFYSYVLPLLCVGLWILMGTFFYHYHNDWPWSQAFFYTCDNGFSVGYGKFGEDNAISMWYSIFNIMCGASLIAGALGLFIEIMLEKVDQLQDMLKQELKERAAEQSKPPPTWCEWGASWIQALRITIVFIIWIGAGTWFGMTNQGWTFTRSVYFAVSSLSTAGLQGVVDGGDAECEAWSKMYPKGTMFEANSTGPCPVGLPYTFCGFYLITGIPVFGICLGQLAGVLVNRQQEGKLAAGIQQRFTAQEFAYAEKLGDGDGEVDFHEFLQISLIKMGAVDTDVLDKIQARFDQIDVGGDGSISKIEMHAAALFDKFDVDESDELNLEEFILLAARLNYRDRSSVRTMFAGLVSMQKTRLQAAAAAIGESYVQPDELVISRETFTHWWSEARGSMTDEERAESQKAAKNSTLQGALSDDEKHAYEMFRKLDDNMDGTLDAVELQVAIDDLKMNTLGKKWTSEDVISKFGYNVGGVKASVVTVMEFLKWWKQIDPEKRKDWYEMKKSRKSFFSKMRP